jgi:hypothetical protein
MTILQAALPNHTPVVKPLRGGWFLSRFYHR